MNRDAVGAWRHGKRLWVVSTASGGVGTRIVRGIRRHFPAEPLLLTRSEEHVRRYVQASDAELTMIVGGDGAWREALDAATEEQVLGLLPAGTLAQAGLELGIRSSLPPWRRWHERTVFLGQAQAESAAAQVQATGFFLMLGVGVEADAVAMVRPGLKSFCGRLAYLLAILARLLRPVRSLIEVEIGTRRWRTCQVLVQRGRYYAGPFPVAAAADVFQPGYRVLIWRRAGRLAWCLGMALRMFKLPARWFVEEVASESLLIRSDVPAATQVDGDPGPALPLYIMPVRRRRIAVPQD